MVAKELDLRDQPQYVPYICTTFADLIQFHSFKYHLYINTTKFISPGPSTPLNSRTYIQLPV